MHPSICDCQTPVKKTSARVARGDGGSLVCRLPSDVSLPSGMFERPRLSNPSVGSTEGQWPVRMDCMAREPWIECSIIYFHPTLRPARIDHCWSRLSAHATSGSSKRYSSSIDTKRFAHQIIPVPTTTRPSPSPSPHHLRCESHGRPTVDRIRSQHADQPVAPRWQSQWECRRGCHRCLLPRAPGPLLIFSRALSFFLL